VLFSKSFEKKKKKNSLASVKNQRTEERERERDAFFSRLILFFAIRKEREREKGYNTHLLDRVFFYCACARRAFEQRFTRVFLSLNKLNVKERERSHLLDFEREIAT